MRKFIHLFRASPQRPTFAHNFTHGLKIESLNFAEEHFRRNREAKGAPPSLLAAKTTKVLLSTNELTLMTSRLSSKHLVALHNMLCYSTRLVRKIERIVQTIKHNTLSSWRRQSLIDAVPLPNTLSLCLPSLIIACLFDTAFITSRTAQQSHWKVSSALSVILYVHEIQGFWL